MVDSDFATNLVKAETQETDVAAEHEKITQGNKVTKTLKEQDVKYKNQELGMEESDELTAESEKLIADIQQLAEETAALDAMMAKVIEDPKKTEVEGGCEREGGDAQRLVQLRLQLLESIGADSGTAPSEHKVLGETNQSSDA